MMRLMERVQNLVDTRVVQQLLGVGFEFTAVATGLPPNGDLTNVFLDDVSINIPVDAPPMDCEMDGVPDSSDNCWTFDNADQRDTDGDGHGNRCDGDFNQDCIINAGDLGFFRSVFFSTDVDADLDGDGSVNFADLGILRALFFRVPGPSAAGALCN